MSSDEHEEFVKVVEDENSETLELPVESDDRLLLTTLQGQFPNAIGLRYQSSSGGWRGVRILDDALNPPHGGWGCDTVYHVTTTKGLKRKMEEPVKEKEEKEEKEEVSSKPSRKMKYEESEDDDEEKKDGYQDKKLLQDMIVLGLPMECKEKDLEEYFTTACGELVFHQIKYDYPKRIRRQRSEKGSNKTSRGFGFIRFQTVEGGKAALSGQHSIMGKTVTVKMSRQKEDPVKLFVGQIPAETTAEELRECFEKCGEIKESYMPQPGRGFGFVTFKFSRDARATLRQTHKIEGARLNVQFAEPMEDKIARLRREDEDRYMEERRRSRQEEERFMEERRRPSHADYDRNTWDRRDSGRGDRRTKDMGNDRRHNDYDHRRDRNNTAFDTASQLKGVLYSILGGH